MSEIGVRTVSARAVGREAPFDYAAAMAMPAWRAAVAWPVGYADSFRQFSAVTTRMLDGLRSIDDADLQDVAILAMGRLLASSLPLIEAALVAQNERAQGIRLIGSSAELDYLRQTDGSARPPARQNSAFKPPARPRGVWLRRIARTKSWTPWRRLPAALIAPKAMAISHNALLRDCAGKAGNRVGFVHAEFLFDSAAGSGSGHAVAGWKHLADRFVPILADVAGLEPHLVERLTDLIAVQAGWVLEKAAMDLAAMRTASNLPLEIWAGSGGYWPVRALSLEILRRGGHVTRFDHGGGIGLNTLTGNWALGEFSVSSSFTTPTGSLADRVRQSGALDLLPDRRRPAIAGANGEPKFRTMAGMARRRSSGPRRVTYAPIPLMGFRKVMPPFLPDTINLDWQMRLVEMLGSMPVSLACRPHPEGLLRGKPHPLAKVTELYPRPFETLIEDTDVFVFDFIQSTTFYEAICTDRPVVLIDMGLPVYTGEARAMLERRCRIVPAEFDDRNRPQIDPEALREAICSGDNSGDPSEFRALLVGEVGA